MRINELILENNQVDEISLGGVAHALGSIPGKAHGAWDAAKAGYSAGRASVAANIPGTGITNPSPATTGTQSPASPTANDQVKKQIKSAYQQGLAQGKKQAAVTPTTTTAPNSQQVAIQQMKNTQQANAQASQADAELVAAVQAAKAKPAFQQTATDKLTIKKGAEKGIHEGAFRSNFLDQDI
jgi:hypothetical protein